MNYAQNLKSALSQLSNSASNSSSTQAEITEIQDKVSQLENTLNSLLTTDSDNTNINTLQEVYNFLSGVKDSGKSFSEYVAEINEFVTQASTKLDTIAEGAEVNVQSDWNITDNTSDSYIQNKPSIYTKSEVDSKIQTVQDSVNTTITNANSLVTSANEAVTKAYNAATEATNAANKANNVNAVLDNDILTVTDRDGTSKSIQINDEYENVTVTATTSVSDVTVSGTIINVYINHDTLTPIQYTLDTNGQTTFKVAKGSYYEIAFPDKSGCAHIANVGYTATISSRSINVEYAATESQKEEIHILTRILDTESTTVTTAANYTFSITVDGGTTEYTTDDSGEYIINIEIGKAISITSTDQSDYKLVSNVPITHTTNTTIKYIYLYYSQTELGVTVLDKSLKSYTASEWSAASKDKSDAFLIRVSTAYTFNHGCDIYLDAQAIANKTYTTSYAWQGTNTDLLLDTPDTIDAYSGEQLSNNYVAQANTQGVTVPAISATLTYQLTDANGGVWKGYLPSLPQYNLLQDNMTDLDNILTIIFGEGATWTDAHSSSWKWTSTQASSGTAYLWSTSQNTGSKGISFLVVPFFCFNS